LTIRHNVDDVAPLGKNLTSLPITGFDEGRGDSAIISFNAKEFAQAAEATQMSPIAGAAAGLLFLPKWPRQ
jgi:hypothetical protein